MQWRTFAALVTVSALSVSGAPFRSSLDLFLHDASFRRQRLETSLVSTTNTYAQRRLQAYGVNGERAWDALPEWNPPAEPVRLDTIPNNTTPASWAETQRWVQAPLGSNAHVLEITDAARRGDRDALLALGARAFTQYPAQFAGYMHMAFTSRTNVARYGLWVASQQPVGGVVRVQTSGGVALAVTCSTCHAVPDARGVLQIGLPNERLNIGALLAQQSGISQEQVRVFETWGPGRLDVSSMSGIYVTRIPDLRPVRWLSYLHHAATLRQRDEIDLALRLETLIITAYGGSVRPPREVALGLALYVRSLADVLTQRTPSTELETRGEAVFNVQCRSCHDGDGFTGEPVALERVGTDPMVGQSPERTTGMYRVPSLRGVVSRGRLLHDASVRDVETLLSPQRTVRGHTWGTTLDPESRSALIAFLRTL